MANSLLAHLYSRIRGSQEDIATISLQYLVSQSKELNKAFTRLLALSLGLELGENLQYFCQATGEDLERPDMAGNDTSGKEIVLCEMKFYAGLTANQPISYLNRLKENGGKGCVFVCPATRLSNLWAKLLEICKDEDVEKVDARCVCVNGVRMSIVTWAEVLERLLDVASVSAVPYLSDVQQLKGYCEQMDSDAFIPFAEEDLTAEMAKKAERYYAIIDEVIDLLCADETIETSKKGLKATAYRKGYTRSLYIDEFAISLNYERDLWKSTGSVETPFWLAVRAKNWKQTEHIYECMKLVEEHKKATGVWNLHWLALEPLTNATQDEVCQDLKRQILAYLDLFR